MYTLPVSLSKTCLESAPSPPATTMAIFSSQDNSSGHPPDPELPLLSLVISSTPRSQNNFFYNVIKWENVIHDFKPCTGFSLQRIKSPFLTTPREAPHCPASRFVRATVLMPCHPPSPHVGFQFLEDVAAFPAAGLVLLPQPLHLTGSFSPIKPRLSWHPPHFSPSPH